MPRVAGELIRIFEGETLPIEVTVLDSDGVPAADIADAFFYLEKRLVSTERACTIAAPLISVVLSAAETFAMRGKYRFAFKATDSSGNSDVVLAGTIWVERSPETGVPVV